MSLPTEEIGWIDGADPTRDEEDAEPDNVLTFGMDRSGKLWVRIENDDGDVAFLLPKDVWEKIKTSFDAAFDK